MSEPRLIAMAGPRRARSSRFPAGDLSVGRGSSNGLSLESESVSRHHCVVKQHGGDTKIIDLDSLNGTFVNGVPVKERLLDHGDQIAIGDSLFLLLVEESEADSPHAPAPSTTAIASPSKAALTYERYLDPFPPFPPPKDLVISWSRDFSRSIDYLETRPDIDDQNLGYFSFSNPFAPVMSAIDGRIKAGAHLGTGFFPRSVPPEYDPLHFAPRAKEPTLILGGRYDFLLPVDACQRPMLRLLGAPEKDKRLVLFDRGHVVRPGVRPEIAQFVAGGRPKGLFRRHVGYRSQTRSDWVILDRSTSRAIPKSPILRTAERN